MKLNKNVSCWSELEKGEFCYARADDGRVKWLHFWPEDSRTPLNAAITPQRNSMGATWTLTGAEEKPTIRPSVDARGIWHGFVTNGEARQC